MKKGHLAAAAVGLGLIAMISTSCAPETTTTGGTSATRSAASSSAPASSAPALAIPAGIGKPGPAGKPVTTANAVYRQSTIPDDDPVFSLGSNTLDQSTAAYPAAELRAVRALIIKFTVEEGIDSTLNGAVETPDGWWAKNKNRFHPDYQKDIYTAIKAGRPFVVTEAWQKKYEGRYRYIAAADKTRIYDHRITVKTMWSPAPGTIAVQMDVSYKIPAVPHVGNTGTGIQKTSGTMAYSATKDASGEWLISGHQHEMKTTEG